MNKIIEMENIKPAKTPPNFNQTTTREANNQTIVRQDCETVPFEDIEDTTQTQTQLSPKSKPISNQQ